LALTPNGKIDKKALTALAQELDRDGQEHDSPATATEKRLADAWADVLGLPTDQIGRQDHFFDLGGTSLSALKLVIALDRAVSVADLAAHPRLASLATFIDHREASHVTTGPQYSC
jgi:acyl carrier protein